jgi:hypothetical protein
MSAVRISFFAEFEPYFFKVQPLGLDFDGANARLVCCVGPDLLSIQAFAQVSALSGADSPCGLICRVLGRMGATY